MSQISNSFFRDKVMKKKKTLRTLFSFPGFKAMGRLQGKFGDPKARIVELKRQKKRQIALAAVSVVEVSTTIKSARLAIQMRQVIDCMLAMKGDVYLSKGVAACE